MDEQSKPNTFVKNPQFWIRTMFCTESLDRNIVEKKECVEILILQRDTSFNDFIGFYVFQTRRGLSYLPLLSQSTTSSSSPCSSSCLFTDCDVELVSQAEFDLNTEGNRYIYIFIYSHVFVFHFHFVWRCVFCVYSRV